MNDLLRVYGRTVAFAAAAALVLSFILAIIRNPFGVALLRAVISALIFGLLAGGGRWLVARYLPEVFAHEGPRAEEGAAEAAAGGAAAEQTVPAGTAVDITLPEENPLESGVFESAGEAEEAESASVEPLTAEPVSAGSERSGSVPESAGPHLDSLPDIDTGEAEQPNPFREGPAIPDKPTDAARGALEREDPSTLARAVRTVLKKDERA